MLTAAAHPPLTEAQSLRAELARVRRRLDLVAGDGNTSFGAVLGIITTFDAVVTPRISADVRARFPEVSWGDVAGTSAFVCGVDAPARLDAVWVAATLTLPHLIDVLLAGDAI